MNVMFCEFPGAVEIANVGELHIIAEGHTLSDLFCFRKAKICECVGLLQICFHHPCG